MTVQRKRVSPPNEYDRFYDLAKTRGWDVFVFRHVDEDCVRLQVLAWRGGRELSAPSVIDVNLLARSVKGMCDKLEREAA